MTREPDLELQRGCNDPVNYLPSELLQEIFVQVGPASYAHDPSLALVSRKWRTLALATPELWSVIFIRSVGWLATPRRLHTWLSRTSQHPLEIHLELRSEVTTENVFSVYKVLAPYLEQRVTRFYTYEDYNVLHLFGDFASRLPNVKTLAIKGYAESLPLPWRRRTVDLPTPETGGALRQMSSLEYLHLCLYPLRAMSAFNAPKLHTLKLECMTLEPQMVLELIHRSPRLKHLLLRTIVWSRDLDSSEWPWREDDRTAALRELNDMELTPINHAQTPINTKVSTQILQLSSNLKDLRVELSSLFDLSGALHSSGLGSLTHLQITLDTNWSRQAKSLLVDGANRPSVIERVIEPGLGWVYTFNSLTQLDLIFSHPTSRHSRKEDYDLSSFLNALAADEPSFAQQARPMPFGGSKRIKSPLPLPKLEHLTLILWDLDSNAVRSFLFCRAPDGPRFIARTSGVNGIGTNISSMGCRISLICCSFTLDTSDDRQSGHRETSEPSLHHASYEEFQSFWFYLREKG